MKEINKKLIKKSFWFALLIILFTYLFFTFISYTKLFYSAKKIDSFNNKEFLRINIYGSSSLPDGNTISGTFSIIDSKGSEIAVIERSWQGSYLAVEFLTVNVLNKSFSFPSSIYGKEKIPPCGRKQDACYACGKAFVYNGASSGDLYAGAGAV